MLGGGDPASAPDPRGRGARLSHFPSLPCGDSQRQAQPTERLVAARGTNAWRTRGQGSRPSCAPRSSNSVVQNQYPPLLSPGKDFSSQPALPLFWELVYNKTPGFPVPHHLQSLPKFMSFALVMPFSHVILLCPLLLLTSVFPSIRDFSNELAVHIR